MPTTTGKATDLITFSRGSLATVTDADGRIKWAPHNLLTHSEQFDASAWAKSGITSVTANSTAAPNGTTTADTLAFTTTGNTYASVGTSSSLGQTYTGGVWLWTTSGKATIGLRINALLTGTDQAFITVNLTTTPTLYTVTRTFTTSDTVVQFGLDNRSGLGGDGIAGNVIAWGAHLYRSDLGGMQANASAYPMYNPSTPRNLLGYSEAFDNGSGWFRNALLAFGSGSVANAIAAPNGSLSADLIVPDTTTSTHGISPSNLTSVANTPYTFSVYVKAGGYNFVALSLHNGAITAGNEAIQVFNLSSGTKGNTYNTAPTDATITAVGDGWYRCSIRWPTATTTVSMAIWPLASDANPRTVWTPNGTSGIYLWGAQLSDSASLDPYVGSYGAAPSAAAAHGPRLDYDPVTLAARGLLVEETRANLLQRSEEFDNAIWNGGTAVVTANAAIAPDGLTTADSLAIDATNNARRQNIINLTVGTVYTFSCYVKAASSGSANSIRLTINNTVAWNTGGSSAIVLTNQWQRVAVTWTQVTTTQVYAHVGAVAVNGSNDTLCYGNVLVWGAQLEAGSFATSYIPNVNTAAGVTRNADVASVATSQFPYSASEGTIVAAFTPAAIVSGARPISLSAGDAARVLDANFVGANNLSLYNGTTQISVSTVSANTAYKLAAAYKTGSYAIVLNGGAAVTNSDVLVNTADTLFIGRYSDNLKQLNGHIRQITYIPRRLSNAELQARSV